MNGLEYVAPQIRNGFKNAPPVHNDDAAFKAFFSNTSGLPQSNKPKSTFVEEGQGSAYENGWY